MESLARAHGLHDVPVVSGAMTGFRLRARLAIRGRLGAPKLGMFELGTHRLVHIPNCVVHHPLINRVAAVVRGALVDADVAMRALRPLPSTRFNWDAARTLAQDMGTTLAGMADARRPFTGVEDRLLWYDGLPYLGLTRAGERRLLAALASATLPEPADATAPGCLAEADALAAQGENLKALQAITRAYEAGVKAFEAKPR